MSSPQSVTQSLLDALVAENKERGLQLAAYHRGELIVDAVAGHTDASCAFPVRSDTLFPIFSVSKGITATLIHRLVERGLLGYETPIARVWPEFSAGNKESITLRHALTHTAGVPHVPADTCMEDLADWNRIAGKIAAMTPAWLPGSRAEYHAVTYGWLVGEPAQRVTGKGFATLLQEEITGPLGIAEEMFIGLPQTFSHPTAVLEEIGEPLTIVRVETPSAIPWWTHPLYQMMNRPDMQRACIPATSGMMSARAIAKHYAALRSDGVEGVRLLEPDTLENAIRPQSLTDGTLTPHVLGYALGSGNAAWGNRNTVFGHSGHGGSEGFYDIELDLAIGFTRNRLRDPSNTPTATLVLDALRAALD